MNGWRNIIFGAPFGADGGVCMNQGCLKLNHLFGDQRGKRFRFSVFPEMSLCRLPPPILTDSYKAAHPFLYPEAKKMVAYGEFRCPFEKDPDDARIVLWGLRYIIETHINIKWTSKFPVHSWSNNRVIIFGITCLLSF
jgi:hypothetical protein